MRSSEDWTSSRADSSPERTSAGELADRAEHEVGGGGGVGHAASLPCRRRAARPAPATGAATFSCIRASVARRRSRSSSPSPRAQPGVVRHGGLAERQERPLALGGELDPLHPAVLGQPLAADEPGALHPVEVVRERRALDPHRLGELALGRRPLRLQREQHEPHRARSARLPSASSKARLTRLAAALRARPMGS